MADIYDTQPTKFSSEVYENVQCIKNNLTNSKASYSQIFFKLASYLEKIEEKQLIYGELSYEEKTFFSQRFFNFDTYNYSHLSVASLRRYFSWRSSMRNIMMYEEIPTNTSEINYIENNSTDIFLNLYFWEMINLIGIENSTQGFKNLKRLKIIFENINRVYRYSDIVHDFEIYYGLGIPEEKKMSIDDLKLFNREYLKLGEYFKSHSAYNYLVSSFYSHEKGFLIEEIMPYVCESVYTFMLGKKIEISDLIGGSFQRSDWTPFGGSPFVQHGYQNPITRFNHEVRASYEFENSKWIKYEWYGSQYSKAIIGYFYKITEKYLREYYHQNSRITVNIDRFLEKDQHITEEFNTFRRLLYGYECNNIIKNTVYKYIENNNY